MPSISNRVLPTVFARAVADLQLSYDLKIKFEMRCFRKTREPDMVPSNLKPFQVTSHILGLWLYESLH